MQGTGPESETRAVVRVLWTHAHQRDLTGGPSLAALVPIEPSDSNLRLWRNKEARSVIVQIVAIMAVVWVVVACAWRRALHRCVRCGALLAHVAKESRPGRSPPPAGAKGALSTRMGRLPAPSERPRKSMRDDRSCRASIRRPKTAIVRNSTSFNRRVVEAGTVSFAFDTARLDNESMPTLDVLGRALSGETLERRSMEIVRHTYEKDSQVRLEQP